MFKFTREALERYKRNKQVQLSEVVIESVITRYYRVVEGAIVECDKDMSVNTYPPLGKSQINTHTILVPT